MEQGLIIAFPLNLSNKCLGTTDKEHPVSSNILTLQCCIFNVTIIPLLGVLFMLNICVLLLLCDVIPETEYEWIV